VVDVEQSEILVLTKEGEITNTPYDEFKERNDWKVAEATPEQQKLLEEYWASIESPQIPVEVTEQILADNPELAAEGITAGEIITVDAEEVASIKLPKKAPEGISYEFQVSDPKTDLHSSS